MLDIVCAASKSASPIGILAVDPYCFIAFFLRAGESGVAKNFKLYLFYPEVELV